LKAGDVLAIADEGVWGEYGGNKCYTADITVDTNATSATVSNDDWS